MISHKHRCRYVTLRLGEKFTVHVHYIVNVHVVQLHAAVTLCYVVSRYVMLCYVMLYTCMVKRRPTP